MDSAEIAIAGGGLSGLVAAIELQRAGRDVLVFEKHRYPRHKVCGEYLSAEVVPYLESLGLNLSDAPRISRLHLQGLKGRPVCTDLPLGGIGISRYALDQRLFTAASDLGVRFRFEAVREIESHSDRATLHTDTGEYRADRILATWGKRSNLDRQQERPFFENKSGWMAVKNHYQARYPSDQVGLYTFPGGYGGLSCTETGAVNFCYLIRQERFAEWKSPEACSQSLVEAHPGLRSVLKRATSLLENPLVISQVSFADKHRQQNNLLYAGDAARLIHPLTGNGMAMAVIGGRLLSRQVLLENGNIKIPDARDVRLYEAAWEREFGARLRSGWALQWLLTRSRLTDFLVRLAGVFPGIVPRIVSGTHGSPLSV